MCAVRLMSAYNWMCAQQTSNTHCYCMHRLEWGSPKTSDTQRPHCYSMHRLEWGPAKTSDTQRPHCYCMHRLGWGSPKKSHRLEEQQKKYKTALETGSGLMPAYRPSINTHFWSGWEVALHAHSHVRGVAFTVCIVQSFPFIKQACLHMWGMISSTCKAPLSFFPSRHIPIPVKAFTSKARTSQNSSQKKSSESIHGP